MTISYQPLFKIFEDEGIVLKKFSEDTGIPMNTFYRMKNPLQPSKTSYCASLLTMVIIAKALDRNISELFQVCYD